MSSKDRNAKQASKDKKKPNSNNSQAETPSDTSNLGNTIKDFLSAINRNRSFSFVVFSISFFMFLIVYFQIKYDQQQRYSPDNLKEDQDVKYNQLN